jgi:excisionase family DNA binding protein
MNESRKKLYLVIEEVADELGCTEQEVRKVIEARKLPALKFGEREMVVPRWCLDAYKRRISGGSVPVTELPLADDETLLAQFVEDSGGLSPQEFYARFESREVEDTSENMTLLVKAVALGAGSKL